RGGRRCWGQVDGVVNRRSPVSCYRELRNNEWNVACAHELVEQELDSVLIDRALFALLPLRPGVLDVVAAAELERDQVVDDVLRALALGDVVLGEDLRLRAA